MRFRVACCETEANNGNAYAFLQAWQPQIPLKAEAIFDYRSGYDGLIPCCRCGYYASARIGMPSFNHCVLSNTAVRQGALREKGLGFSCYHEAGF